MGWKGTLRSVNAELNRQSREADKRKRENLKEVERKEARAVINNQKCYLQQIVSLHQECRAKFNWDDIASEPELQKPENKTPLTNVINRKLQNLKPLLIDRLPKVRDWRKKKLEKELHQANFQDEIDHAHNISEYEKRKDERDKKQRFFKKIRIDGKILLEALQEYLDIAGLPIGQDVKFKVSDDMKLDLYLKVLSLEDIIPEKDYGLRQSGTLSTKKMAKGKRMDLYQDYVCSALLRVVRETFGVIPMDMIRANAVSNAVNTKTGHLEDQLIISAIILRDTLDVINLDNIDPSDAFSNFIYNMKFLKTKGFEKVEKVDFPSS